MHKMGIQENQQSLMSFAATSAATPSSPGPQGAATQAAPRRPGRSTRHWTVDALMYLGMGLLLLGAFKFSRMGLYDARSDLGYWIGVAGAVMMVLLFAYPLRKRSATLARFGKAKIWFVVHMVLGILGPVFVLAHSTFRIGSLNAGVALVSMLVVAASGVMGRFIYLRIHQGLGGQLQTLDALQAELLATDSWAGGALNFAPEAAQRLQGLKDRVGTPRDSWLGHLQRLVVLPWQLRRERRAIRRLARQALRDIGARQGWDSATLRGRERKIADLVSRYADTVQRTAQLSAYTKVFSLWHVLHVPFVFLMILCAVAHVVAVHAY